MSLRTRTSALAFALAAFACSSGADPESEPTAPATPYLVDATASSGLDFMHHSGARGELVLTEIMGGGAALFDCDRDGDLDAFLVDGGPDSADPGADRAGTPHRIFLNDGGGRFVSGPPFPAARGIGMGVAAGDADGDGLEDLYVTSYGPDRLYRNVGDGRFEDVSEEWGLDVPGWSCSAAFLDFDADGDLDLFVTQYIDLDLALACRDGAGRATYCPPKSGKPLDDVLLRNDGGRFTDVSAEAGIAGHPGAGLGVVCEDFDADGRIDVYVANDGYANHLWRNQGDGTFAEEAVLRGAAFNQQGAPEAGMGVLAEDLDADGRPDLFLTHLQEETNTFYRSRASAGTFTDDTGRAGLHASTLPWTGFGVAALDLELDGDLDLAVANGRVRAGKVLEGCALGPPWDVLAEPNLLLVAAGGAYTSEPALAPDFTRPIEVSRGIASGDVDGDGDLDLVVTEIEGSARLYLGEAPRAGRWLVVDARRADGTRALNAVVTLEAGSFRRRRAIRSADGYLTARDPRAHFALPVEVEAKGATLSVDWPAGPDGGRERFALDGLERAVVLRRGEGEAL